MLRDHPQRHRLGGHPWPRGRLLVGLVLLGMVAFFLQASLYLVSVTIIPSSLATVIFYTAPVLVVLIGLIFFGIRPNRLTVGCLITAVIGTGLVAGEIESGSLGGALMAFGAAVVFACYTLAQQPAAAQDRHADGPDSGDRRCRCVVHDRLDRASATPADRRDAVDRGRRDRGDRHRFAMGAFFAGLRRVGPAEAAILSTAEPIVTILVGVVILDEHLSAVQIVGALLVLVAVTVLARDTG